MVNWQELPWKSLVEFGALNESILEMNEPVVFPVQRSPWARIGLNERH